MWNGPGSNVRRAVRIPDLLLLATVAGCGRIGFDLSGTGIGGDGRLGNDVRSDDDGNGDGSVAAGPSCGGTVQFLDAFTTSSPFWTTTMSPGITVTTGGGQATISFNSAVPNGGGGQLVKKTAMDL